MSRLVLVGGSAPSAPAATKTSLYCDSADSVLKVIDSASTIRALAQNALHSATGATGAINTTETIITGGLNNARIYANQLKVGSTIRAILQGTCTSTVANASTWKFRLGTAGTTSDAAIMTAANSVAAASGTTIPFEATLMLTVRTIGASATAMGYLKLINTGVTGISAVAEQVVQGTMAAFDSTVNNWLSATYVSAATTTTSTFQVASIEVVKI